MRTIQLKEWTLRGGYPFVEYLYPDNQEMCAVDSVPARVPGSVYADLLRAGVIDDPYFETNSLACEWVANRWWVYETTFSSEWFRSETSKKRICFEGIENLASVWLNGKRLARLEGANLPFELEIETLLPGENRLKVVLESEQMENGQLGRTSEIATQKPRFGYKWDFCVRLVNVGIYGEVRLTESETARIADCRISDRIEGAGAELTAEVEVLCDGSLRADLEISVREGARECGTRRIPVFLKEGRQTLTEGLTLDEIKRWYPNGSGAQNLYRVFVRLLGADGRELDGKETVYGFRTIRLLANEGAKPERNKFLFEINGRKTYLKGFNYVPVDLMYGSESPEKVDGLLRLARDAGCNLIRVWGGGYVESRFFYERCCEYGLLVWQDFLQSSSGADSIPNNSPAFLEKLRKVSAAAIRSRRNYPCLAVWCGGNELRAPDNFRPHDGNCENLRMLRALTEELDPDRIFFATTPLGDNFCLGAGAGDNDNVHGNYKYYLGEYGYYHNKYYNDSDSLFHAEFGTDGVANEQTLKKILSPQNLLVTDGTENSVWRHLSSWWDTLSRERFFFGTLETLSDYVYASQYVQAEGLRYIVECNRRRAFYNSGCIIWQLNEPNPNACCTNVVDYDLQPKQAYFAVKKSFQPVLGCVRYEKLDFKPGEIIDLTFYFVNDRDEPEPLEIRITADEKEFLFRQTVQTKACGGAAEKLFSLSYENVFEYGLRIDMRAGEYENSVLILSRGKRGFCDLNYVRRQKLWTGEEKS